MNDVIALNSQLQGLSHCHIESGHSEFCKFCTLVQEDVSFDSKKEPYVWHGDNRITQLQTEQVVPYPYTNDYNLFACSIFKIVKLTIGVKTGR